MAKIKKRRLSWKASSSSQVVGYKLYWSEGSGVDYSSKSVQLGNVTEIVLPDAVASFNPGNGPIEIGLTAVDELGNESDMATLSAPYQFCVPEAPQELKIETMQAYHTSHLPETEPGEVEQKNGFASESPSRHLKSL